jgi:leucyl/phenylalanyl-tRNA--protein transferase
MEALQKWAFIALIKRLEEANYKLLNCQIYNEHMETLGCREIDISDLISILSVGVK